MTGKLRDAFTSDDKDIEKKSVFWNMTFSILSASQSAVMIAIVTRGNGTESAGILSIAFAVAYLMYTIGAYGARDFHATDSLRQYSYNEYKRLRLISCGVMIFISLIYCLGKGYERDKLTVVILVCVLKLVEAMEDLYHGEFQRAGRLDIAGRLGAFRLFLSYVFFALFIFLTHNLLVSIASLIFLSVIIMLVNENLLSKYVIKIEEGRNRKTLLELVMVCFPLFIMLFLSIYISNAPKYAIDKYLSEQEQAYYAIISMPVFTINLLSGIVYRPKLLHMAELWNMDDMAGFKKLIWKQVQIIIIISIVTNIAGCMIGLKLLEMIYGVSLTALTKEFAILLLGGGMVAMYGFFSACLTIMRKQVFMLAIAVFVMALAGMIANPMVRYAGLTGAAALYLILMLGELLSVLIILGICLHRSNKTKANKSLDNS